MRLEELDEKGNRTGKYNDFDPAVAEKLLAKTKNPSWAKPEVDREVKITNAGKTVASIKESDAADESEAVVSSKDLPKDAFKTTKKGGK